jgi:glycerol-3-phosphate dehydrogenase
MIKQDSRYGNVICRCETVTEAEVVEAIRRGAHSIDSIKRRLRAGMGRCQGGFCGPRVLEILARELGISPLEVCKNEKGSEMLAAVNKERGV